MPVIPGTSVSESGGGSSQIDWVSNRRIHPSLGFTRWGGPLSRGVIYTPPNDPFTRNGQMPSGRFHFLIQPHVLQTSYTVNETLDLVGYVDAASSGTYTGEPPEGGFSMNFDLMIDRTYEVAEDPDFDGAWHDVSTLLKLTGFPEPNGAAPRFISQRILRVMVGHPRVLMFDGMITNLTVDYTHFARSMVPMRAVIRIAFLASSRWGTDVYGLTPHEQGLRNSDINRELSGYVGGPAPLSTYAGENDVSSDPAPIHINPATG